jgi:hypothetical protein
MSRVIPIRKGRGPEAAEEFIVKVRFLDGRLDDLRVYVHDEKAHLAGEAVDKKGVLRRMIEEATPGGKSAFFWARFEEKTDTLWVGRKANWQEW